MLLWLYILLVLLLISLLFVSLIVFLSLLFTGRCVVSGTRSTWVCSAPLDSPLSTGSSLSHGRTWFVLFESLGHLDHLDHPDHLDLLDHLDQLQVPPELAEPLLCTTFTLTYFFHLTSFYWMFLEGFYLFLQVAGFCIGATLINMPIEIHLSFMHEGRVTVPKRDEFWGGHF